MTEKDTLFKIPSNYNKLLDAFGITKVDRSIKREPTAALVWVLAALRR